MCVPVRDDNCVGAMVVENRTATTSMEALSPVDSCAPSSGKSRQHHTSHSVNTGSTYLNLSH